MPIPHFSTPLRVTSTGSFAVNEQDDLDDLAQCTATVIATPLGSRIEVPEFGTPRSEFQNPVAEEIVAAVQEWEPRVDLDVEVVRDITDTESVATVKAFVRPHV